MTQQRRFFVLFLLTLLAALPTLPTAAFEKLTDEPERVAQAGGILKVYSNIKGARVFLNDEEVGKTPTIRLLPPGRYKVRLVMTGYETYEEQIEILANKAVTINATLTKIVGSIEVVANVDGARVFLEGVDKGQTPNVVLEDLPSGSYQIEVKKPGYASYSGPITVKPNVRLKLRVELIPNAAVVALSSNPPGAKIFMDDKELAPAPLTLDSVPAGRHALRFELPGHGTYYRVFQVTVGEKLEIKADLPKQAGGIRVRTKTPGADVFLEGSYIGKTPIAIEKQIAPGQYSLRVSRQGYADFIQPVVIEPDRVTKVTAELISLDQAGALPVTARDTTISKPLTKKWWFWTAVGGVVAAAAGGTAVMLSDGGTVTADPIGDVVVPLP